MTAKKPWAGILFHHMHYLSLNGWIEKNYIHTHVYKTYSKDLSGCKRKSLFHSSLQPGSLWPAGQLNSLLFNDPIYSYHLWIRGILQDLAREGVQDSWSNTIWWTHSPFFVSPSPAKPLSTCKNPPDFSGISHWLNAKHTAAFIAPPPPPTAR